jgi:hypothetical protein
MPSLQTVAGELLFRQPNPTEMPSGANTLEISDIQEDETEASQPDDQNVTMLHSLEHRCWKFLRSTGELPVTLLPLNPQTKKGVGRMTKGRMEAFSDGVFAVIITIMVLEMKTPPPAGGEACYGWRPVGEPAFVVLAIVDPVRYRLDGGEPFCALAGGVIRGCVTVRRNRLFPSDEDTDRPPRKRFNAGNIDWK